MYSKLATGNKITTVHTTQLIPTDKCFRKLLVKIKQNGNLSCLGHLNKPQEDGTKQLHGLLEITEPGVQRLQAWICHLGGWRCFVWGGPIRGRIQAIHHGQRIVTCDDQLGPSRWARNPFSFKGNYKIKHDKSNTSPSGDSDWRPNCSFTTSGGRPGC